MKKVQFFNDKCEIVFETTPKKLKKIIKEEMAKAIQWCGGINKELEEFGEMVTPRDVLEFWIDEPKTEEKWKSIYSYMIECCGQELDFHFKYLD